LVQQIDLLRAIVEIDQQNARAGGGDGISFHRSLSVGFCFYSVMPYFSNRRYSGAARSTFRRLW
jgi:hypothetical protein